MESDINDAGEFMDKALNGEAEKINIERDKKMTECFRRVFSTPDGKIVLHQILEDLEFFNCRINSPQEIALNNYAKFMIFKRLKVDNTKKITEKLMEIE